MKPISYRKKPNGVPILSRQEIDTFAERYLYDYKPELVTTPQPIPIEKFVEFYLEVELDFQNLSTNKSVLGMIAFNRGYIEILDSNFIKQVIHTNAGTIFIDNHLLESQLINRYRFTLGHEVGHLVLHRHRYTQHDSSFAAYASRSAVCAYKCSSKNIGKSYICTQLRTDDDWQEWQADYFASALLMPKFAFECKADELFKSKSLIKGNRLGLNLFEIFPIVDELAQTFCVSRQAAGIRLHKLGYIDLQAMNLLRAQNN